ncbi:methyl-CpG-binding domain-containing protein 13-like isoform X3 [Mangifera indica]|nr:methyl-CpG-binding domain-containing protein 13-like isoform X3 [Mangifera indica]
MKEIRITKSANKVRRDPVYIDPVSGYFFRSMRDASRYLETGEIGRLAYKPKDKGGNNGGHDEELGNEKCNSPTAAKKQKLETPGTEAAIVDSCPKTSEIAQNEDALNSAGTGEQTEIEDALNSAGTGEQTEIEDALNAAGMGEHIVNKNALNSAGTGEHTVNENALNSSNTRERICLTEHASYQDGPGIVLGSSNLQEAKDSNKMDGEKDSDKSASLSTSAVEVCPHRPTSEDVDTRNENKKTGPGKRGSRKKEVDNLPRRASKRLAGVALDPTPELKPVTRGRHKQSDEKVASAAEGSCSDSMAPQASQQPNGLVAKPKSDHVSDTTKSSGGSIKSSKWRHLSQDSNEQAGKTETDYKNDKKQGCDIVLPKRNSDKAETSSQADAKPGPHVDLPFGELLSDPCIAFAIQTLTGATFDASNTTEVSLGSNNSVFEGLNTSEEQSGRIKRENEGLEKQDNLTVPKGPAVKAESSHETDEKPGPPFDLPFAEIWRDPCIEFAIKTLTSSNPVGCDLDIQDYFHSNLTHHKPKQAITSAKPSSYANNTTS